MILRNQGPPGTRGVRYSDYNQNFFNSLLKKYLDKRNLILYNSNNEV